MKFINYDFAATEMRAFANVAREQRRQLRRKRWVFIGKLIMWIGITWLIVFLLAFVTGCGTLAHGPTQDVSVTSEPPGAVVTPTDYKRFAYTPGTLVLDRNQGTVLTARLYGYKDCEVEIKWGVSPWAFGNMGALVYPWLVAGCQPVAAAWGLDADSIGDLSPRRVHFEMVKK